MIFIKALLYASRGNDEVAINVDEISSYMSLSDGVRRTHPATAVILKNGTRHEISLTIAQFEEKLSKALTMQGRDRAEVR